MRADDLPGLVRTDLSVITAKYVIPPIAVLEQIGVRIHEDDGTYWMSGGRLSGAVATHYNEKEKRYEIAKSGDFMLYRGADLKTKLASAVYKRGVRVYERTILTSLITKNGSVVGATAVNTRNGKFYIFKSKFIIMATGSAGRLNNNSPYINYPNNLFLQWHCPVNAGGGHIAAYRAGAELVNMEFLDVGGGGPGGRGVSGSKRAIMKNYKGENIHLKYPKSLTEGKTGGVEGAFSFMPDLSNPLIERDVLMSRWEGVPANIVLESVGAFSCSNENPYGLKGVVERGGVRAAPTESIPACKGFVRSMSGVMFDQNGETSVKGLFVAGDMVGALPLYGSTGAFAWGYKIADYLRELAPQTKQTEFGKEQLEQVRKEKQRIYAPIANKDGFDPLLVENLVRNLVTNYVGIHKIEPRMKRCLEHLQTIRERMLPFVGARSYHELMRAIELYAIIDLAEIHTQSAITRNETRLLACHHRIDYPERDDENWYGKVIVANMTDGKPNYTIQKLEKEA
jgi:succinate dehydrogenase/fumarate reductase flavoprotein subunit